MGILGSMVKAKSMELKSKTREFKMRLIIFWLLKDKKVLLGSTHHLSPNLQTLLTHHHHPPPLESTAVIQEKENKEERMMKMKMMMMMSKQGIKFVQVHNNNNNHTVMPPVHTKISMPVLEPIASREEDNDFAHDQEEEEEDKNDDEVVNVTAKDQPWTFVEDEVITDDGHNHCSKYAELDEDDDDDKNINIDEAADLFIRNFRRQLRLQKNQNFSSSS